MTGLKASRRGNRRRSRRAIAVAVLGLAVGLAVLLAASVNFGPLKSGEWLGFLELKGYDWMTRQFSRPMQRTGQGEGPVAVVAIDQESIEQLGPWPWDRSIQARMVDILHQAGAGAIAIDILFSSASSEAGDRALAASMERAGNVVLASSLSEWTTGEYEAVKVNMPLEILTEAAAGVGYTNIITDADGINRRVPLAESLGGRVYSSFAALSVATADSDRSTAGVIGSVPVTGDGEMLVNFSPEFNRLTPAYSFLDVLGGKFEPGAFRGKTVFLGVTGGARIDGFPTPISGKESPTPGVVIQARAAATIESGSFIRVSPPWLSKAIVVLVGVTVSLLFLGRRMWMAVASAAGGIALLVVSEGLVFRMWGLWLPLTTPVIVGLLSAGCGISYRYFAGLRRERSIKETFGRYVSPEVLGELLDEPESASRSGRQLEVSILFCDMYGFTTIAGSREPGEVVELLNRFLTSVSRVVFDHGGTVDKFVGDEVMAIFGAPVSRSDHAVRACMAALDIQSALEEEGRGQDISMRAGVGVNSGRVVVGSVGSEKRMDYTAVGDTVNVASRLQALTRETGYDVVIGPETYRLAGNAVEAESLGLFKIKGKEEPVEIYGLKWTKEGPERV